MNAFAYIPGLVPSYMYVVYVQSGNVGTKIYQVSSYEKKTQIQNTYLYETLKETQKYFEKRLCAKENI